MSMRGTLEDTICAVATPVGEGGIGIVRISGPAARQVAAAVVRLRSGQAISSVTSHVLYLADLVIPSSETDRQPGERANAPTPLDEGLVVYMKAPRSFTGEDVVEIHSHGGALILSLLSQACVASGARCAEPGEFTKRAFLNGRLDLSQAEAVLDTIRARSSAGLAMAQRQLRGELAREVEEARAALLHALAQVEAGIDFVEEDISFLKQDELQRIIKDVSSKMQRLAATYGEGRLLRDGARVVILGRPNVGKSSLLNRLLKEERAIVTPIPGTTRDVIEESLDIGGLRVHVVDTAGIRDSEDPVEREGIRRSRSLQSDADLQLIVLDGSRDLTQDDVDLIEKASGMRHILVVNKSDLPAAVSEAALPSGALIARVSAKGGEGIDALREMVRQMLVAGGADAGEGIMVTNARHRAALTRALQSLRQAQLALETGMAGEFLSIDLRAAAEALGEITGAITTDEILDRIFSEFCIGK